MTCKGTSVQPSTTIQIEGVPHGGIVTHKCSLPKDHDKDQETASCQCACGYRWVRNFK